MAFKTLRDVCQYLDTCRRYDRPVKVLRMTQKEWADVQNDPALLLYIRQPEHPDATTIMGTRIEVRDAR